MRKQLTNDAALGSKEIDLARLVVEQIGAEVAENEVENHKPGLDVPVALDAPVLRIPPPQRLIYWFGSQVIDMPSATALDYPDVMKSGCLFKKPRGQSTTVAPYELTKLPAQEVTGMNGSQIEERGLALQVADGLERLYRIVVQFHRSRMFSIRWWSSSIFEVTADRSEAEA
jgi:hypothetical protein